MLTVLREGKHMLFTHIKVIFHGMKKYSGDDDEICLSIINDCYDKDRGYFKASNGNYQTFYSRDFGWCIQSLLNLGFNKEVHNTLKYVMEKYHKQGNITVAINNNAVPFNFPDVYSPDSVAYLYRCLRIAKAKDIIIKYKRFLNDQLITFESNVIDSNGLLIDKRFSGMRDHIRGRRLCYDMIMACMLCDEVDKINHMIGKKILDNVLSKYDLRNILIKQYWNGRYFDDGPEDKYCSGHANTYPYFLDVITDIEKIKSSINSIHKYGLDTPLPLKYGYSKITKFIWQDIFAHDWEKDTTWAMLGLAYIDVVSKVDTKRAKEYLGRYHGMVIKHRCFIELYSGYEPYKSLFFTADDSMLWASMYLDLKKRLDQNNKIRRLK